MTLSILAGIDHVQQQGERGRQSFADRLLGQAYAAPPEQRQSALAKLAGVDGRLAIDADRSFSQNDQQQQAQRYERLSRRAKVLDSMDDTVASRMWPAMRAELAQVDPELGAALPMEFDSAVFRPMIRQLAGADKQTNLTPSVASVEDAYRRQVISKDEYDKGMRIALDLAPGASAPRVTYVDRYDPGSGRTYKEPMLTGGLDYTNSAPSLGRSQPPGQTPPASREYTVTPGQEPFPTDPLEREAAYRAMTEGGTFHVGGGAVRPGYSSGVSAEDGPPTSGISEASGLDTFGGGFPSGPSNAERVAQAEREAAAGARGRVYGEREAGPNFDDESSLRGEYNDAVKGPRAVVDAYRRVEGAARNPSAAGDLSMIFAFMKMLDPGSVVREQEFANAQNAAGVPDQIRNLWNRALQGERLNPNQRADFLRQAEGLRTQAEERIAESNRRYRDLAPAYHMDADRIAPKQGGPIIGDVEDGYRYVGGDPGDEESWEAVR